MTPNNSATGGYLLPAADAPLPGNLTFEEFLQTVFVGITGMPGDLVRPKWQLNPPKQPDATVDWLAIGLEEDDADVNAFVGVQPDGSSKFQRMEALSVKCSFYGPNSYEFCKLLRDGFQIKQNLQALQSAGMNFVSTSNMVRAPDIVNERWVNRWEMSAYLRREILRVYPILTFLSGSGTLKANNAGSNVKTVAITVEQ